MAAIALGLSLFGCRRSSSHRERPARSQSGEFAQAGVKVDYSLHVPGDRAAAASGIVAGAVATLRFRVQDASNTPLTGLRPAAWMDIRSLSATDDKKCRDKIQAFIQGDLVAKPTIDLNTYYVAVLNDEPSLSILDPIRGFSRTKLLTIVPLPAVGQDWVLAPNRRLFVSTPEAHVVAVVDTDVWKVVKTLPAGTRPGRTALQPDGRYLWVGSMGVEATDVAGVVVFDTVSLKQVAEFPVGVGPHDFAFSPDDRRAFISDRSGGNLTIVDIPSLKVLATVPTGPAPTAVGFSDLANAAYVADGVDGSISAIDANGNSITARIRTAPGVVDLTFLNEGRWGFAANPDDGNVFVFDTTINALKYTVRVGESPHEVAFGTAFAYVRSLESSEVTMINLAGLGTPEGPSLSTFPAGQATPAQAGQRTAALAPTIIPALEPGAVLVANPADKLVYYYMEGMAAPMGSFSNYSRFSRAVLLADRSLRETTPGTYEATVQLPARGTYDVAFLLDSPRLIHCFEAKVAPNPAIPEESGPDIRVEVSGPSGGRVRAGGKVKLALRVLDSRSGVPAGGLRDLTVRAMVPGRSWHRRAGAVETAGGEYIVEFDVGDPGVYYFSWECPSKRFRLSDGQPLIVNAYKE